MGMVTALDLHDGRTLALPVQAECVVGDVLEIQIPPKGGAPTTMGTNENGKPIIKLTEKYIRVITNDRAILHVKEQKVFCELIDFLLTYTPYGYYLAC